MKALAAAFVCAAACGQSGTVDVTLVTAPGSTVLDNVETLQLTLTDPLTTETATRQGSSFSLSFSFDAAQVAGQLIVQGMDAGGTVIAVGESPPFPVDALSASVSIFVAAPNSVAASPVSLDPAVDQLSAGALSFGVVIAGGRDASHTPQSDVSFYNAFDHSLTPGASLPAARAAMAMTIASGTFAYFFGGTDASGAPQANDWLLDTSVAPAGGYADFGDKTGFERAGQTLLQVDATKQLLTGMPAVAIAEQTGTPTARADIASLPAAAVTTTGSDAQLEAIFVAASGVTRYRDSADAFDMVAAPTIARDGATLVALPSGLVGVFCGGADGATVDAVSGAVVSLTGVPSDTRASGCAVAATAQDVVIAGGTLASGDVATTAEIFDATTLAPIAAAPLVVPRTNATAIALPTGQVMIVGGEDATGAPIATIELFTPSPILPP